MIMKKSLLILLDFIFSNFFQLENLLNSLPTNLLKFLSFFKTFISPISPQMKPIFHDKFHCWKHLTSLDKLNSTQNWFDCNPIKNSSKNYRYRNIKNSYHFVLDLILACCLLNNQHQSHRNSSSQSSISHNQTRLPVDFIRSSSIQ